MKADEFKVGDEVYCFFNKKGKCIRIEYDRRTYPVIIRFETGKVLSYTSSGKCEINGVRTLFFEEIIIPESAYKRPRWRAVENDIYYFVDTTGKIGEDDDNLSFYDGGVSMNNEHIEKREGYMATGRINKKAREE